MLVSTIRGFFRRIFRVDDLAHELIEGHGFRNSALMRLAWGGDSAELTALRYLKANGTADGGVDNDSSIQSWHYIGKPSVLTKLSLIRTNDASANDFTVRVYKSAIQSSVLDTPEEIATITVTDTVEFTTETLDVTIESGSLLAVSISGSGTAPGPLFLTMDLEY